MNKFVLLSTVLAFLLPSVSYGMEAAPQQHQFKRKYQPENNQQNSEEPPLKKGKPQLLSNTERLSTPQSHRQYLQDAILSANKSILITSFGVDGEAFEDSGLYGLLAGVRKRGVKVYIYNIDSKDTDDYTLSFFQKSDIFYDVAYTHAKLLAIDDKKVAIGSYNWLSKANNWENATLCLSGEECKDLVPLLWQDLTYYRNRQFGNIKQIREYENNSQNQDFDNWDLGHSTRLYYLHSLKQHRSFIAGSFQSAEKYLIFCAPFIIEKSGYKEDFEWNLLSKTINRGVHICFACRAEDPNLPSFKDYLGGLLNSPFMHLIPVSDIHQKTVIVDDVTIAEGSFNLLSASRDEKSEYHNHEVTLMLHGTQAKGFIQEFSNSRVGQAIINAIPKPQLNNPPISQNNVQQNNYTVTNNSGPMKRVTIKEQRTQKPRLNSTPANQNNTQQNHSNVINNSGPHFQNIPDPHSQRRARWLTLNWQTSAKGNPYINISAEDGNGQKRNVVISKSKNSYCAIIDGISLNTWYPFENQAKQAAFDYIWFGF